MREVFLKEVDSEFHDSTNTESVLSRQAKYSELDLDGPCRRRYQFGMSVLKDLRARAGLSQAQLAALANTSQPQIKRLEDGERKLTREWAERLAPHLGVTPDQIVFPEERMNVIGVKGIISGGGTIETGDEQPDPSGNLFEITVPFPVPDDAIAFVVRGESMWPRYDPDDVVICSAPSDDPRRLLGWEAAVATPDGHRYLKRLLEGSKKGLYTLESHNAGPIRDVRLKWASEVLATVRARRWNRLTSSGRKRAIKKAVRAAE